MKLFSYLSFCSCLLLLVSCKKDTACANKGQFLETAEAFALRYEESRLSSEVETDSEAKLAVELDTEFKQLVNDCYKKFKAEMSLKERQDFWTKTLKYFLYSLDLNSREDLNAAMDDPFNVYVKDEVMELVKESGIGFMMSLQELMKDDLPRLMDVFAEEIEKIGKEFLENMFK